MNRSWNLLAAVTFAVGFVLLGLAISATPVVAADKPVAQDNDADKPAAVATEEESDEAPMKIKVYRVADLLSAAPNYAYDGTFAPSINRSLSGTSGGFFQKAAPATSSTQRGLGGMGGGMGGMGGGMGGMGGGGFGGGGGGMFNVGDNLGQIQAAPPVPPAAPQAPIVHSAPQAGSKRLTAAELIEALETIIEPASWDGEGGPGAVQMVGGSLVVRQSAKNHEQIETLLSTLRHENESLRTLSIHAQWLLLDPDQAAGLRGSDAMDPTHKGLINRANSVDQKKLDSLPADARWCSGEINCLDGQTVHIISGHVENVVEGAIPVTGSSSEVGLFQPVIRSLHHGALLQVSSSFLRNDEDSFQVLTDVQCLVSMPGSNEDPTRFAGTGGKDTTVVQVDRPHSIEQQLATTLRMPLGRPVLVGGLTFAAGQMDPGARQLYLILEVRADR